MAPYRPARVLITATCSLAMLTAGLKGALSQAELDLGFVLQGEPVPPNTLRIVALGTGTPFVRRSQVATSYLLQLGGTRNILFDIGTGSIVNLYAAGVDLSTVDTVFLSHLHSDHVTDLAPLHALNNQRRNPLRVYGPSGAVPETGTAALVEGLKQFLFWDIFARNHISASEPLPGSQIEAHEFDYTKHDQLVFEEGNIKVYSNPAYHFQPGPVSLRLEWNGLAVSYSGDTIPLETFVDFASGSDVVIHESVGPILNYVGAPPVFQTLLANHTFQAEVGAVFQALQPRLAITTHLTPNSYVYIPLVSGIRSQYPTGPLAIATDFDVWDITTTSVRQRRLLPLEETSGYSVGVPNGQDLATSNLATIARPEVVAGNLRVFQLPTDAEGVNAAG